MTEKCRTVLRMCIVFFRCRYGASELHSVAAFIGGETRHRWPRSHVRNVPWVPETFHVRFPVSVKSTKNQVKSSGFAARVFGRRPKTCRPAADKAPRHTREKISGSQGISNVNSVPKNAFEGSEKHKVQKNVSWNSVFSIDCSQSPIFSWDRWDIARLTVNDGHLDFQMYRGSGRGGL